MPELDFCQEVMFVVSLILHNQHFIYLINHIIIYWPTLSTLPPPSPYPSPASLLLVIYDHSKNARPAQRVEKPLNLILAQSYIMINHCKFCQIAGKKTQILLSLSK